MDVCMWHKSLTCRHTWLFTSQAVWFITSSYQVTLLPQFHQREGSHSMDTLSAVDCLCVLSLFHTASFIGKPAGLAAPQLQCKSGGVSMQWPADEVMVKNDLSLMRNVVILQRIHYKWQASSPLRFFFRFKPCTTAEDSASVHGAHALSGELPGNPNSNITIQSFYSKF